MPMPRKYRNNAEKQAAYRARQKAGRVVPHPTRGNEAITRRVMDEGRKSLDAILGDRKK